jgi:hypothetical protein
LRLLKSKLLRWWEERWPSSSRSWRRRNEHRDEGLLHDLEGGRSSS